MKFPQKKYLNFSLFFKDYIHILFNTIKKTELNKLQEVASIIEKKVKLKKNIFLCGNGGSASLANHYIADYFKLLRSDTKLKPRFYSLVSNMELITAISNDMKFEDIFSYQLETLAKSGDLLILISSSGNSKNLINAIKFAKKIKMRTVSFVGFNGGILKKKSDVSIHTKVNNYGITEDASHIFMHTITQFLRQKNLTKKFKKIRF
mgnify:CR=1 FL=1|tara:strand:- start:102 stop:719 length:618 start_codon:yes stop_codon:yes gene_type:complete